MKFKKNITVGLCIMLAMSIAGCSSSKANTSNAGGDSKKASSNFSVAMVSDTGGINDQSFNQSAWEGLQKFGKDSGAKVSYLESKQSSDYVTNLDRLGDNGTSLIWSIGYDTAQALLEVGKANPDKNYAIVDNSYDQTPANVTGVVFRAQEPSFLVGYVAGKTTKTNQVGFIGGMENAVILQFQYGYEAGVAHAAKELGKEIKVSVQYAESFTDSAKGKAVATKMFSDGCDIVYAAAGGTGTGVIEAAKETQKIAIGVDRDQAYLAPKNVLTSALKLVGKALGIVSQKAMNGEQIGGKTLNFGLKEDCVGIPENHENMPAGVYEDTLKIEDKIKAGEITPPATKEAYEKFVNTK